MGEEFDASGSDAILREDPEYPLPRRAAGDQGKPGTPDGVEDAGPEREDAVVDLRGIVERAERDGAGERGEFARRWRGYRLAMAAPAVGQWQRRPGGRAGVVRWRFQKWIAQPAVDRIEAGRSGIAEP